MIGLLAFVFAQEPPPWFCDSTATVVSSELCRAPARRTGLEVVGFGRDCGGPTLSAPMQEGPLQVKVMDEDRELQSYVDESRPTVEVEEATSAVAIPKGKRRELYPVTRGDQEEACTAPLRIHLLASEAIAALEVKAETREGDAVAIFVADPAQEPVPTVPFYSVPGGTTLELTLTEAWEVDVVRVSTVISDSRWPRPIPGPDFLLHRP